MEINFFKKKKKFRKGGMDIKPDLYWRYILYMVFVLIIASCAFGIYLFWGVNTESAPIVNSSGQDMIKKERLDKVLEYFSEREKKSVEILNSPSPIVDPSL